MSSSTSSENTSTTRIFTADEILQILTDVLRKLQSVGVEVIIIPEFWFEGKRRLGVVINDVAVIDNKLVPYQGGKAE